MIAVQKVSIYKLIVSIAFCILTSTLRHTHPLHHYYTINFDLKSGKQINLSDIFQNKYLKAISSYSKNKLIEIIGQECEFDRIESGTTLQDSEYLIEHDYNFKNWFISKEGLIIYFSPYQVSTFWNGNIVIPFKELEKYKKFNGLI